LSRKLLRDAECLLAFPGADSRRLGRSFDSHSCALVGAHATCHVVISLCLFAGPPARSHDKIYDTSGKQVGEVTSGVFGPTVKGPVSMGYVDKALSKAGTELQVDIRGKKRPIVVAKMPFTAPGYYRG
jgi:glycine cleavage system aminomethyltransferase T